MSSHIIPLTLEAWAGSANLNLTLVFNDIVESTLIGKKLGDRKWIEDLFVHFSKGRFVSSVGGLLRGQSNWRFVDDGFSDLN
ncbi:MAG TPA: hypothetical protein VMS31_01395 [Pyrinomonadaceae bacterium]|nr:hypothetical protein [Pyrinomonadaceae bacterium]